MTEMFVITIIVILVSSFQETHMMRTVIRRVQSDKLFVSEPDPSWFGNERNPSNWEGEGWSAWNWLTSRFHFEFAEYKDVKRQQFGSLRVMNDDLVQPKRGFGTHPHRDMEIITYVVEGELTHKDSMGTAETLGRGSVQFMTAGSGISHSEYNKGTAPARFIQSWIVPRQRGLTPKYGSVQQSGPIPDGWKHYGSSTSSDAKTPFKINQEVDMHTAVLRKPSTLNLSLDSQSYVLCVEGSGSINGQDVIQHDGLELVSDRLRIDPGKDGIHILSFTMPQGSSA